MKVIPITLLNTYHSKVLPLATLFKLTLRDGTVMGFTSFNKDIILEDDPAVIYKAFTGITPSAITSSNQFNVDNLDVEGFLDDESITESDLKSGRYDWADVLIAELSWADRPYLTTKLNIKRTGKIGQVSITNGQFVAEIRGLMQSLQNNIGPLYQTTCRANLGDSKCCLSGFFPDGKTMEDYTTEGQVYGVSYNRFINIQTNTTDNYFYKGVLKWTSGLNVGLKSEIKSSDSNMIELQLPANYKIELNDTFQLIAGCSGIITECQDKFKNAVNFRGEPYVPQAEQVVNTG